MHILWKALAFEAIFAASLPPVVNAQWIRTNGPYGTGVAAFATIGSDLFAGIYFGGVFRSTDNCTSWIPVNNGLPRENINCMGARGADLFAATGRYGGIFRSTDNGANWKAVRTGSREDEGIYALAFSGTNIFASGSNGMYRSTGDTSWTRVDSGFLPPTAAAFAVVDTKLFAGTVGGMYLSTNNGTSWKAVNDGLASLYIEAIAVVGQDIFAGTARGVYRLTDGSTSWKAANNGLGNNGNLDVYSLAVKGQSLFAVTWDMVNGSSVFLSTDNGTNWNNVRTGLTPITDIRVVGVNGTNVVAGTSNGVFLSSNDGASWSVMSNGLPGPGVTALAVGPVSGETGNPGLLASTDNGVFLSTNNGTEWQLVLAPIGGRCFAVSGTDIFAGTAMGFGIYRSTDNGRTWNSVGSSVSTWFFEALAVSGTNLYAGTNGPVLLSTDNGNSWRTTGMTGTLVYALAVDGTNLFAGTYNKGVFLSTNEGTSWIAIRNGLTDSTVYALAVNGGYIFAGTERGGVFSSSDSGTHWTQAISGLTNTSVLSFAVIGRYLFAGTTGGVFSSHDNGLNWINISEGLTDNSVDALCIAGTDLFAGIASGNGPTRGGSVWRRPLSEMVSVKLESSELPTEFALNQNYPNPFNPSTTIKFELPRASQVHVSVYDVLGREVSVLVNERRNAGVHEVKFEGSGLSSGVYFYRLQAGDFVLTKRLVLLK